MLFCRVRIQLILTGRLLTQSSEPERMGVDTPIAVNGEGKYYLPYSLVKGTVKQSLLDLIEAKCLDLDAGWLAEWMGRAKDTRDVSNDSNRPDGSRLRFADFVCHDKRQNDGIDTRVRIDPVRQAAREGQLQIMDSPFAAGERARFTGHVDLFCTSREHFDDVVRVLDIGFRWIAALGANKNSGFGQLVEVAVDQSTVVDVAKLSVTRTATRQIPFRMRLDRPFCLAKRKIAGNLFESDDIISGAAIKGALASTLREACGLPPGGPSHEIADEQWKPLADNLSRIRITHAFPTCQREKRRPVQAPASIAVLPNSDHSWVDWAVQQPDTDEVPAFFHDWKDGSATCVREAFGWRSIPRHLRVRTSIDDHQRRAADEMLFAQEVVDPTGMHWLGAMDLSAVEDDQLRHVCDSLERLFQIGLRHVGKTKAAASIDVLPRLESWYPSDTRPVAKSKWIVTLQTPALLCRLDDIESVSTEVDLRRAYEKAWRRISNQQLQLVDYYASQTLAGGEYLARRFHLAHTAAEYKPYLLTAAGSVFVVQAADKPKDRSEDPKRLMERLVRQGLPIAPWATDPVSERPAWQQCPFRPEEGYGEIAVNIHKAYSTKS